MKRAKILCDTNCGVWGVLPAGVIRDVVDLTEEDVTVRFWDESSRRWLSGLKRLEAHMPSSQKAAKPITPNGNETVVLPLDAVELTNDLPA